MKDKLTKQQIIDWAISNGWHLDKYGHLQKAYNNKQYRCKLSSTALRCEVRVKHESGENEWVRFGGGYYKDLTIKEGKLGKIKVQI